MSIMYILKISKEYLTFYVILCKFKERFTNQNSYWNFNGDDFLSAEQ